MPKGMEKAEEIAQDLCNQLGAELHSFLGAGAFKAAYKISLAESFYALKIAPIAAPSSDRLRREVAALQACDHANIARLAHAEALRFKDREYLCMVEEFLEGGTLEHLLTTNQVSDKSLRLYAASLASAIAHLQSLNLVHRDIKPANILFRKTDDVVLTDFGIVRALGLPSLTHDFIPQGPGTPLYSSPEQLCNDKAAIDWRSDQFGLALVLAECVLGRPAFAPQPDDLHGAVNAVARHEHLAESTKAELENQNWGCLLKALSPWPVQRYRTPELFLRALGAA